MKDILPLLTARNMINTCLLLLLFTSVLFLVFAPLYRAKYRGRNMRTYAAFYAFLGSTLILHFCICLLSAKPEAITSYHFYSVQPFSWLFFLFEQGTGAGTVFLLLLCCLNCLSFGFFLPCLFPYFRSASRVLSISFITGASLQILLYLFGRFANIDCVLLQITGSMLGFLWYRLTAPWIHQIFR